MTFWREKWQSNRNYSYASDASIWLRVFIYSICLHRIRISLSDSVLSRCQLGWIHCYTKPSDLFFINSKSNVLLVSFFASDILHWFSILISHLSLKQSLKDSRRSSPRQVTFRMAGFCLKVKYLKVLGRETNDVAPESPQGITTLKYTQGSCTQEEACKKKASKKLIGSHTWC